MRHRRLTLSPARFLHTMLTNKSAITFILATLFAAVSLVWSFGVFESSAFAQGEDADTIAIKEYQSLNRRATPGDRVAALRRLAKQPSEKTLEVLIERYDRCPEPKAVERALIAQFVGAFWCNQGLSERLAQWLDRRRSDLDVWLWERVLNFEKGEEVIRLAEDRAKLKSATWVMRSACLSTLARRGHRITLAIAEQMLEEEPPNRIEDRALAREAIASVLVAFRDDFRSDSIEPKERICTIARKLVDRMDEPPKPGRAEVVLARLLARALDPAVASMSKKYWKLRIDEFQFGTGEDARTAVRLAPAASFAGVETTGRRIAFLIDLSDSMLKPLSEAERVAADGLLKAKSKRAGGESSDSPAAGQEPAPSKEDEPSDEAPLLEVKTRLDLARALVAKALRELEQDQQFVVIGFGFEAKAVGMTAMFVPAKGENIGRALGALDRVTEVPLPTDWGVAANSRPDGKLWGYTNPHAAFRLAFATTSRKLLDDRAFIAPDGLAQGCDTIFLLSDGAPTWSDYSETRASIKGERYRDLESDRDLGDAGEKITIIGPYRHRSILMADVLRMNTLRRAQINTIGIGEADPLLLRDLAEATGGSFRSLTPAAGVAAAAPPSGDRDSPNAPEDEPKRDPTPENGD